MRIDSALQAAQTQASPPTSPASEKGDDFGKMLMDAIKDVNATQQQSVQLQNELMAGRPVEYHDLMIAMEKSSTAMALTLQVRNKLLESYQEISRMNV